MDALEAIASRRAVRQYTGEIVEERIVRDLLNAATLAPSAENEQPWCFTVIQDKEMLKRLSDHAKQQVYGNREGSKQEHLAFDPEFDIFYNAGTLVVFWVHPIGNHPDWDCCFAAENFMIAARGMGLGTCPIGLAWPALSLPEVKEELNVPPECTAIVPIVVGYARDFPPTPARHPVEILSWQRAKTEAASSKG